MMSAPTPLLVAAAAVFAMISGANDGGSLIAVSVRLPSIRPLAAAGLLALAIVVVPLTLGMEVATTLATGLVDLGEQPGTSLLAAIVVAVAIVTVLTRVGLPTSLTLALIGAIAGVGLGLSLPVDWRRLLAVLAIAALAPVVGALAGFVVLRSLGRLPPGGPANRRIRWMHRGAFTLQCIAYAANDGQKMLALLALAVGGSVGAVRLGWPHLVALAALFSLGLALGVRRVAATVSGGIMLARPTHVVAAELSSAGAVLGSSMLGAPVSMTQSILGGLVGSGVSEGYGRIRWQIAGRVGMAWVLTLPTALLLAMALSTSLREVWP
ncbi:MAG: inorganic phosphate transporter [Nitriliruptorales bacterium]